MDDYLKKLHAKAKKDGYELHAEIVTKSTAAFAALHPDVVQLVLSTVKPVIKATKNEKVKKPSPPVLSANGAAGK